MDWRTLGGYVALPSFGAFGEPVTFIDKLACRLSLQGCGATGGPSGLAQGTGEVAGQALRGLGEGLVQGLDVDLPSGSSIGKGLLVAGAIAGGLALALARR